MKPELQYRYTQILAAGQVTFKTLPRKTNCTEADLHHRMSAILRVENDAKIGGQTYQV
jgi:hypothetical protein